MALQIVAGALVVVPMVIALALWRRVAGPALEVPGTIGDAVARMVAGGDAKRAKAMLAVEPDNPGLVAMSRVFAEGRPAWETLRDECRQRQTRVDRLRLLALATNVMLQGATLGLVITGGPLLAWPVVVLYGQMLFFQGACLYRINALDEVVEQGLALLPLDPAPSATKTPSG